MAGTAANVRHTSVSKAIRSFKAEPSLGSGWINFAEVTPLHRPSLPSSPLGAANGEAILPGLRCFHRIHRFMRWEIMP